MRNISQRSARFYKKRVQELESVLDRQKNRWNKDWGPGWANIETLVLSPESYAKISTARLLHCAVILTCGDGYRVHVYAERQERA